MTGGREQQFYRAIRMTIPELISCMEHTQPPAPADVLEKLETLLKCRLPEDYRAFLLSTNGGSIANGYLWFRPNDEDVADGVGLDVIGGLRDEEPMSLLKAIDVYQGEFARIPLDLVWVAADLFGNAICLGLNGVHRGRIYFWDHESEPDQDQWDGTVETAGNITLLADSFTEFAAGLRPDSDFTPASK